MSHAAPSEQSADRNRKRDKERDTGGGMAKEAGNRWRRIQGKKITWRDEKTADGDDVDFSRENGKHSLFPPTFSPSCPTPTRKSQSVLPNR